MSICIQIHKLILTAIQNFCVDQERSLLFYHKIFQVIFPCQDFPYGNSVRAERSCTGNIRKGTPDWKAQNLQRVAGKFVYPLFWVCFRT